MTNSLKVHASLPLVEEILSPWQERIGTDYDGYKNHVYRMLHCCFALAPPPALTTDGTSGTKPTC